MKSSKKKILVAVDGSNNSKRAVLEARRHLSMFDSELTLLTISKPGALDNQPLLEEDEAENHPAIQEALALLDTSDASIQCLVKIGDPADHILDIAEKENYDLIIMGYRGLGRFSRTFLGSVSNKVLNHSNSNVLIVR